MGTLNARTSHLAICKMEANCMEKFAGQKRGFDSSCLDEPDLKRPNWASVITEALKVETLHKLCSSLEPILRRIVSEELEIALRNPQRKIPKSIEGRDLQLLFMSKLAMPLFTGGRVEAENGGRIHVVLVDAATKEHVKCGPESLLKLDVVVLEGDFNKEEDESWAEDEFDAYIVKERDGKRPLVTGDMEVTLKEGSGTLGELGFTDNSSWVRSRKFRLGLKVANGFYGGFRVREAVTEAFNVKDHRGELYKKHYPPAPNDEVWRLEKIGKDGSFHKRLNAAGIRTVEEFLHLAVPDSQKMRNILGSGMSNKMWEALVDHSRTCAGCGRFYVYCCEDVRLVFNSLCLLRGFIASGRYYSIERVSDDEKMAVEGLARKAYVDWMRVEEYDWQMFWEDDYQKQCLVNYHGQYPAFHQEHSRETEMYPQSNYSTTTEWRNEFDGAFGFHTSADSDSTQPQSDSAVGGDYNFIGGNQTGRDERSEDVEHMAKMSDRGVESLYSYYDELGAHGIQCGTSGIDASNSTGEADDGSSPSRRGVMGWVKLKAALRWGVFVTKKGALRSAAEITELD